MSVFFLIFTLGIPAAEQAQAVPVRLKDIIFIEGIRDNLLVPHNYGKWGIVGYGLVVGLNGTGDNLSNNEYFLERLGMNTRGADLKPKNTAAVIVTATLPPFSRQGLAPQLTFVGQSY